MPAPVLFSYLEDAGEFPAFFDVEIAPFEAVRIKARSRERLVDGEPVDGVTCELELGDAEIARLARALDGYLRLRGQGREFHFDEPRGLLLVDGAPLVRVSVSENIALARIWHTLADPYAAVPIEAIGQSLAFRRGKPCGRSLAYSVVQSLRMKLRNVPLEIVNLPGLGYQLRRRRR